MLSLSWIDDKVEKLLGWQIEPGLKWHKHIDELLKKLKKRLKALENLRNIIPYHLRKTITSVLVYCLPVFGGCDKFEIEALQRMQNKAAIQLIYYHYALSTYRIRQEREPEYLSTLMNRDNERGSIIVPNTTLTLAKKSFCFRGSTQWNSIPVHIRNTIKISQFKRKLKSWILLNIDQFT